MLSILARTISERTPRMPPPSIARSLRGPLRASRSVKFTRRCNVRPVIVFLPACPVRYYMQIDCNKLFLLLEVDNSADERDYDGGNRITASDLFRAATEPLIDIVMVYNQDDVVAGWLDNRDGFSLRDFFTFVALRRFNPDLAHCAGSLFQRSSRSLVPVRQAVEFIVCWRHH